MASRPEQSSDSTMSQSEDDDRRSPTTFASLPREIRDQIYELLVVESGVIAATTRATDYGNCEAFEAIRTILHASTTTRFPREAYEVFFHQNTFRIYAQDLPEFVHRKSHYLKDEGYFDVNAWIGRLEVTVFWSFCNNPKNICGSLVNELRQLLIYPRLHTVTIQIECAGLRSEEGLREVMRAISEVCAQLRERMGDRFKVETDGNETWGNKIRQPLSPWLLGSAASTQ